MPTGLGGVCIRTEARLYHLSQVHLIPKYRTMYSGLLREVAETFNSVKCVTRAQGLVRCS